ncbi:hypothetical protein SELMODRAFT_429929 [Selaginella moellendorffii]|uniref:Protein kinase domain-containing protein n=1 Tax=Selaginella moellendorffii TaxID=88036 RepID=D8T7S1_SELML|nr:hypothetical protein SELMODRAFT_429929 [Selaginella moellendorffii]
MVSLLGNGGSSESTWRNPHSHGENTSGWSHPEERIAAWDVVAGYTSSAVYAAALEDLVGLLTPGKFADFVVLSESPFGQGTGIFPPVHICENIGEEKAARIIKQLVKTFKEIYLRGVVHQNLKVDNILSKPNMHDKWSGVKRSAPSLENKKVRVALKKMPATSTSLMSMAGKHFQWLPRTTAE